MCHKIKYPHGLLEVQKIKGIKMILCMDIFGNRINKIYDM